MLRSTFKYLMGIIGLLIYISACYATDSASHEKYISPNLRDKIGQMLIVGFGGRQDPNGTVFNESSNVANAIKNEHVGGVILFSRPFRDDQTGQFIKDRNIQSPQQVAKLTHDLQTYSTKLRQAQGLSSLPLFITIDQEGGMVNRLSPDFAFSATTIMPAALGMNEERVFRQPILRKKALQQTRQYADQLAESLAANNFNVNFAPSLDVNVNPLNPIIGARGRSFSSNPRIVADQAWQFVQAFHDKGIIPVLKHFPGHGSSSGDSHEGLVDVTHTYQRNKELLPYRILINKGYKDIIMTTHVINGQIDKNLCKIGNKNDSKNWCPGTMSKTSLTTLLRKKLGFKGVIVSDDMTMGAITNEYALDVALEKSISAGVDMFIIANSEEDNTTKVINTIVNLVKQGKVSEAQIDRAYNRIVMMKKSIKKYSI